MIPTSDAIPFSKGLIVHISAYQIIADDIDLIGRDEEELQDLTTRLEQSAGKFGMEISAEKSRVLVNSNKDTPQTHIIMNGKH